MHHVPAGPPLSARLAGALSRWALLGRRAVGHRSGRLALSALLSTVVTALVLALPVVGGAGTPSSGSAFVLGPDGKPLSSDTFAGLTSAATFSSATGMSAAAPSVARSAAARAAATAEPSATGSLPGGTGAPVPAPVPAPAPAPVPVPAPEPAPGSAPGAVTEDAPSETAAAAADPESPVPAPAPTPVAPGGPEAQVLALVNAERADVGCRPVAADDALAAVARAHSEDMRDRGFFDHVNPDGLDPFDRAERAGTTARAENIAVGQPDAAAVMSDWMNSPGHRANILDCSLTRLGTGVATGSGGPWWTQVFG